MLREIGSGLSVGVLALPFCVSAGVVAFEPLGPAYVSTGAAAGILCAVAGGIVGSLLRPSSFIPNVTSTTMALVQASLVGWLIGQAGGRIEIAFALMPLVALLAGLWQGLIAATGLARIVKFTPYPVLAGFLTGLALLMASQQVPRLFGVTSLAALAEAAGALSLPSLAMPLFGLALVVAIVRAEARAPRAPVVLLGLAGGTLLYHGLAWAMPGIDLGPTIGAVSLDGAAFGLSLDPRAAALAIDHHEILKALLLTSLTLAILGTLDLTFALRAAQNLGEIDASPSRNLAGQAAANVVASLVGGMTVTTSIAFTRTNFIGGGRTRLSTVATALALLALAAVAPALIGTLPRLVLSAVLVAIAYQLWDRWCLEVVADLVRGPNRAVRVRAQRNAAIVAAVAVTTLVAQPVAGALVGVALSCLVFIVEMSRPVVRRARDATQVASKRIRSQADRAALALAGPRVVVLELQGILFFGNADDLASRVKALEGQAGTVILDLRRVSDLDTSGAAILKQIARRCAETDVGLLVSGLAPAFRPLVATALEGDGGSSLFPDLDSALEHAENRALAAAARPSAARALRLEETDLAGGLSERETAALKAHLRHCAFPAGAALCRAGDPADRLWLLVRGSVSVRLPGPGQDRRVASLGPGTAVGLLDRRPRSADVVADEEVEAFTLSAESFDRLLREEPHLGQSLLATVARLTAQRLRATSAELMLVES